MRHAKGATAERLTDAEALMFIEPYYAVATTVRPDGSPHSTVVWVDYDGEDVLFNTAEGRAKPRHLRENPNVNLTIVDPDDAYRWVSVSGPVEISEEGAAEHINQLARKYWGRDYSIPEGQRRLIVRVKPQRVTSYGLN
jgi:PPOX class probable F420-dependent enzyme